MYKNKKQGFTLIELLVVVAIIGILASVVLGSLNSARGKGNDAAIKANLANVRSQAEIYYSDNGNYGTVHYHNSVGNCENAPATSIFGQSNVKAAFVAAESASGSNAGECIFRLATDQWAMSMPLRTNPPARWCVDSSGVSKQIADDTTLSNIDATCD